jgi:muconate cycloisomerase
MGLKITGVEALPVRVPVDVHYRSAYGVRGDSEFVLVRVTLSDGIQGWGEASLEPLWPEGETQASVAHAVKAHLAPAVVGSNPLDFESVRHKMGRAVAGNPYAKAAVEMGILDAAARSLGLPLYTLLGGHYRGEVEVRFNIPYTRPEEAARLAARAVEQGFRVLKVKVGVDLKGEVAILRAIREVVGSRVEIGVDANGAWRAKEAVQAVRRLGEFGLAFVEQPVDRRDLEGLALVRRLVDVPVMVDEGLYTPEDALALVRLGACDLFNIYPGKAGGLLGAKRIAHIGEAAGIPACLGSNIELGVGNAAKLHLAASTPSIELASDFPVWFYSRDVLKAPLKVEGGRIRVPEGPGLGVEVDPEALKVFRVGV